MSYTPPHRTHNHTHWPSLELLRSFLNESTGHKRAKKKLGQHFLWDIDTLIAISTYVPNNVHVYEIGCGVGFLTRFLLQKPLASFVGYEVDKRCTSALELLRTCAQKIHSACSENQLFDIQFIYEDAIEALGTLPDSLDHIASTKPVCLVGNIPYNLSGPLLMAFLRLLWQGTAQTCVVLVQKEVALRLLGSLHSKEYGPLAILTQLVGISVFEREVDAHCFEPTPKVMSAVVRIEKHTEHHHAPQYSLSTHSHKNINFNDFAEFLRRAFACRRKMLRHSFDVQALKDLDIDPTLRPQNISAQQYIQLWWALKIKVE